MDDHDHDHDNDDDDDDDDRDISTVHLNNLCSLSRMSRRWRECFSFSFFFFFFEGTEEFRFDRKLTMNNDKRVTFREELLIAIEK